ncbi:RNA methyltransferase RlmH [Anaerobutyricum hallii]|uniref:RNA methyltransferase RlmH n=1 Tax=Anaerobutyricum hallii TaxID=39488 RepID=A0A285PPU0_9FIRM|nr:23S rRNA (pseudouridine(1915)-N(3))-methyltransferase RlmH [Anaerobutyricum hallii]SOB71633.1 RNA methyltransferase RlmH [Anaerobutyricum hallii]
MKYEVYIQESKKSQKFCKKAIAEYEKRLSRYCKISCKFIKKEKEWESLLVKDAGMKKFIVQPGKAELTSERLSEQIKNWEGSGIKGIMFFVPEWNEEILADAQIKKASKTKQPIIIESLVLSDFTMSSNMTGMVLYEQIYRGYRILNNHPYHK